MPAYSQLPTASTTPGAAASVVATAGLDLSPLAGAAKSLSASPPINAAHVATVKAAIADGSYQVDPNAIAERMLTLEAGRG